MLAYMVLAGRHGAPVDPDLVARFDRCDPPSVPFRTDDRIVWRNDDESLVFLGWQVGVDYAGIRSHWSIDTRGLTAFSGHCWPLNGGWRHGTHESWASQLRRYLGDIQDPEAIRESLFGQFTILSLSTTGPGWAMPDWANMDQMLVASSDTITAVSNRAGLCAHAVVAEGSTPRRSVTGAGWLWCEGWVLDHESGYWDVDRPPAGSMVWFRPHQGARVVEPARSPMLPPPDASPLSYDELLDENEGVLRAGLRGIADLPIDDIDLPLSGGKDSRTLTAIVLSEGLRDRFRFVTHGSPERADAIAAGAVARRFGLNWVLEDWTTRTSELELENALLHTALTEGTTSSWSTFSRPDISRPASISGIAGEGMRWKEVSGAGVTARTIEEITSRLRRVRPIDPMRILRPEARSYYQTWADEWIQEQLDRGISLLSIPAIYFQEPLLHSRNGPDYAWSARFRFTPYANPTCLRTNHRLPVDAPRDYRFHLDLQRRCNIELSKMPFAEATWDESMYAHLPDAAHYRRIEPIYSTNQDGRTWRQKRYADYLPFIAPIVLDRSNPIHDLLDYDRLAERIATGDANAGRTRNVWGVLTAAIWMSAREELPRFEST